MPINLAPPPIRSAALGGQYVAPDPVGLSIEAITLHVGGGFRRDEWLPPEAGGKNARLSEPAGTVATRLYKQIETARSAVLGAENAIMALEKNRDPEVSDYGRAQKRKRIAEQALKEINSGEQARNAMDGYSTWSGKLKATMEKLTAPPQTPNEVAVAQSIRDHIARLGESKLSWLNSHAGEPQVVAVVMTSPGFLYGLSEEDRQQFLQYAQSKIHPHEHGELNLLRRAWEVTTSAASSAQMLILSRARVRYARDGKTLLAEGESDTTAAPPSGA